MKTLDEIKEEASELFKDKLDVEKFLKNKADEKKALEVELEELHSKRTALYAELSDVEKQTAEHFGKQQASFDAIIAGETKRIEELELAQVKDRDEVKALKDEAKSLKAELTGKIAQHDEIINSNKKLEIDLKAEAKRIQHDSGLVDQESLKQAEKRKEIIAKLADIAKRQAELDSADLIRLEENNKIAIDKKKLADGQKALAEQTSKLKLISDALDVRSKALEKGEKEQAEKKAKNETDAKNNKDKSANLLAFQEQLGIKAAQLEKKGEKDA